MSDTNEALIKRAQDKYLGCNQIITDANDALELLRIDAELEAAKLTWEKDILTDQFRFDNNQVSGFQKIDDLLYLAQIAAAQGVDMGKPIPVAAGIDIGGTNIRVRFYPITDGSIRSHPVEIETGIVIKIQPRTELGFSNHVKQMEDIFQRIKNLADIWGLNVEAIGIGEVGRTGLDGLVKKGTAPQLSKDGDSFDGKNLKKTYNEGKNKAGLQTADLADGNDAKAMLSNILAYMRKKGARFDTNSFGEDGTQHTLSSQLCFGHPVHYFGFGTGLGHDVQYCHHDGTTQSVADGHASKIALTLDAEDAAFLEAVRVRVGAPVFDEVFYIKDGKVRAEDMMRGPAMALMAGVDHRAQKIDIDHIGNAEHRKVVEIAGKYAARLIKELVTGKQQEIDRTQEWRVEDKEYVAQYSRVFMFGGGLGMCPVGDVIFKSASDELKRLAEAEQDATLGQRLRNVMLARVQGVPTEATYAAASLTAGEVAKAVPVAEVAAA